MPGINNEVFKNFAAISRIPRESGNEKTVSDYIRDWAIKLGLEVSQDEVYNLSVKKPGAPGYEDSEPVILQAHLDMVCEKNGDCDHDFAKDPIELLVEGDWVRSAKATSLGADNGIGVACIMSILEDKELAHPPIEGIFTVEEETTFKGASNLKKSMFSATRMINLDHCGDSEVVAGSCGGTGAAIKIPVKRKYVEIPDENTKIIKIRTRGLLGGHSGEDIHRGRGNAIDLLIRILAQLEGDIISLKGGTNRLAIPREAEAVLAVKKLDDAEAVIGEARNGFLKEYGAISKNVGVDMEIMPTEDGMVSVLDDESRIKIINGVRLHPNGILEMCGNFDNTVESSINLGIIDIKGDCAELVSEIRGLYGSSVENTKNKIKTLAELVGVGAEFFAEYSPWEYKEDSLIRNVAMEVYRDMFGTDMKVLVLHAGLECGFFAEKEPEMDIIAIGPNCESFHSPNERVSISSTEKFYDFLKKLLENLA